MGNKGMSGDSGEARAARALWAAVLEAGIRDALTPATTTVARAAQEQAHAWLVTGAKTPCGNESRT